VVHSNYITISLKLQEFSVLNVKEEGETIVIEVEGKCDYASCPSCGRSTDRIHQRNTPPRRVEDLPIQGRKVILIVRKRRFICSACGKVFTEVFDSIEPRARRTIRYERYLYKRGKDANFKELSLGEGIAYTTCRRLWYRVARREVEDHERPSVRKMGVDEFSRAKGHKYDTVLTDLDRHKVVEVLKGRSKEPLKRYLENQETKPAVFVVDMHKPYVSAIKEACPGSDIVIDKFHVIRKVNEALDRMRKILQRAYKKRGGRKRFVYRIRWLLLKGRERLTLEEKERLDYVLGRAPLLAKAYDLKETFRDLYKACENYEDGRGCIESWCNMCDTIKASSFKDVSTMVRRWIHPISLYFKYRVTNGYTEGVNNKIKTDKRMAYGYRNFENQRIRVLSRCG